MKGRCNEVQFSPCLVGGAFPSMRLRLNEIGMSRKFLKISCGKCESITRQIHPRDGKSESVGALSCNCCLLSYDLSSIHPIAMYTYYDYDDFLTTSRELLSFLDVQSCLFVWHCLCRIRKMSTRGKQLTFVLHSAS